MKLQGVSPSDLQGISAKLLLAVWKFVLKDILASTPNFEIKARSKLQELRSLPFARSVWVLKRSRLTSTEKMQETRSTVYRPYLGTLQCLAIRRSHSKGSTLSSLTFRPWVIVDPIWGLNLRPPARKSNTQLTELTSRSLQAVGICLISDHILRMIDLSN